MKERLTFRNMVLAVAVILGIVALILAFSAGFKAEMLGIEEQLKGVIFGKQKSIAMGQTMEIAKEEAIHAKLSGAGVVMLLVAPVLALVAGVLLPKKSRLIIVLMVLVAVVGTIFVFMLKNSYASSEVAKGIKVMKDAGMEVTSEMKKEMLKQAKEEVSLYNLNGAAVFTGIIGILEVVALSIAAAKSNK